MLRTIVLSSLVSLLATGCDLQNVDEPSNNLSIDARMPVESCECEEGEACQPLTEHVGPKSIAWCEEGDLREGACWGDDYILWGVQPEQCELGEADCACPAGIVCHDRGSVREQVGWTKCDMEDSWFEGKVCPNYTESYATCKFSTGAPFGRGYELEPEREGTDRDGESERQDI